MSGQQFLMLGIFLSLILGLSLKRVGIVKSFAFAGLGVYVSGIISTEELLSKASSPVLVTLVLIMLISIGLERLGWIKRLSSLLVGPSLNLSLLRLGVVTAFTSSFLNNTAVVATLMHTVRANSHHAASRLLMPLSYMAILGGTMTLVGTSTNLIVAALYTDATGDTLAFFDFLPIGLAISLMGLLIIVVFARLLPVRARAPIEIQAYLVEADVSAGSALIGKTVVGNGLRELEGLFLVEIVRGEHLISPVGPQELIESGDKLIFSGDINSLVSLRMLSGISLYAAKEGLLRENLVEVIVLPNANIEGKSIKEVGFRALFDAAVVGIRRGGRRLSGQLGGITLKAGDSLMLAIGSDFYGRQNLSRNFAVLTERMSGQPMKNWQAMLTVFCFGASVIAASLAVMPLIKGLLVTLGVMLACGIVPASELRRRFPFELWIIITAALMISQGMSNTGLTSLFGDWLSHALTNSGPIIVLTVVYVVTVLLTELVTNNAAAALMFPLALALAEGMGVSVLPFTMVVAYGASASFLTPYGYATNLMVQNVGNYRLADYFRIGVPVTLGYGVVAVMMVPMVFPF